MQNEKLRVNISGKCAKQKEQGIMYIEGDDRMQDFEDVYFKHRKQIDIITNDISRRWDEHRNEVLSLVNQLITQKGARIYHVVRHTY